MTTRTSQTDIAVLGALSVEPMSGYALRAAIRDVLGHFWSESFGQIYPTLTALEAEGLVKRNDNERGHGSTFSITRRGLARLRQRLAEPPREAPPRNGLMLRLFFGRQLGPAACRELVAGARADAERALATYAAVRAGIAAEPASDDHPYFLLTVAAGEHTARAVVAWADEALATLTALEETP